MEFKKTKIILDKERQMKLTLRGIVEFNDTTGIDILAVGDLRNLSPKELYVLLWACLIWEDAELKLEVIPEITETIAAEELMTALLECIKNSLPEAKPETVPLPAIKPDNPLPLTGSKSGASDAGTSKSMKFLSGS